MKKVARRSALERKLVFMVPSDASSEEQFQNMYGVLSGFLPDDEYLIDHNSRPLGVITKATSDSNSFVQRLLETCNKPEFRQSPELLAVVLNAACGVFPYSYSIRKFAAWFCNAHPTYASGIVLETARRLQDVKPEEIDAVTCQLLAEVENHFLKEVTKLRVGEVDVWPLVRPLLAQKLRTKLGSPVKKTSQLSKAERTKRIFKANCSVYGHYHTPEVQFIEDQDTWEQDLKKAEFLFYSHYKNYEDQHDRLGAASRADFLCDLLSREHKCLRLEEFFFETTLATFPRRFVPKFFKTPWKHSAGTFHRSQPERSFSLEAESAGQLETFMRDCARIMDIDLDKSLVQALNEDLKLAEGYALHFKTLLEGASATAMFIDVEPIPEAIGMLLACRALGIPVVQIPQETIEQDNDLFTHWFQVPGSGFNTKADILWACDEAERTWLENAGASVGNVGQLLAGGMPQAEWSRQTKASGENNCSAYERAFLESLEDGAYTVFVSLDHESLQFSSFAFLAKLFGERAQVLVHLDAVLKEHRDEIQQIYARNGLNNIEFVFSTVLPREMLLHRAQHVITNDVNLAREALEYDAEITVFDLELPDKLMVWKEAGRISSAADLGELAKAVETGIAQFEVKAMWQDRLEVIRNHRKSHLPCSLASATGALRQKIAETDHDRQAHAKRLLASPLFADPVPFDDFSLAKLDAKHLGMPDLEPGTRTIVTVAEDVSLNRSNIARLFAYTYSRLGAGDAIDFVFTGQNTIGHELELTGIFSGMNAHSVNVHLDSLRSEILIAPDCRQLTVTASELQSMQNVDSISLPRLVPSDENLGHVRQWLASRNSSAQTVAMVFSDWLTQDEVHQVLQSSAFQTLASQKDVIVNGSHHFERYHNGQDDLFTLFEPGIHSIEAVLALSNCVDVNVIVSEDVFDMVFYLTANNPMHMSIDKWC